MEAFDSNAWNLATIGSVALVLGIGFLLGCITAFFKRMLP